MNPAIVLDCGTGTIKAGFSDSELPQCVIPSVLGKPRQINPNENENICLGSVQSNIVFGDFALRKRGLLNLRYPIEHGIVINWDDMEKLLHHTFFNELRTNPKNECVFLSEAALNPRANREKCAEILFEKFNIESMAMASQSILGLYSSGRTNGMILESGEGVTHCVPIYEGYSLPQAILRSDIGGRNVTDYLVKLLAEKGNKFITTAEREIVRDIKERKCYIAQNYAREIEKIEIEDNKKCLYELPDGSHIEIKTEKCKATEILFEPSLIGLEEQLSLMQLINESIKKIEVDLRRMFYKNIVLIGGNTMFNGMKDRLNSELSQIVPSKSVKIKINAQDNRKYCVWIGSSIISNMSSFRNNWMKRKEFEENGVSRIHSITRF